MLRIQIRMLLLLSTIVVLPNCLKTLFIDGGNSVYKDGDIMLQGLFPLTHRENGRCERIDNDEGLTWMLGMMYAIDEINKSSFLSGKTLGYKIDNTCFNIPTAMNHAISIVSQYRSNSICRAKERACHGTEYVFRKKISAVIGPAISWISIPVASLLGLYNIPQISYGSTSRILSDKSRYKGFLRTIPSDEFQAQAMVDFVRFFHWNYVYLMASDDDYGKMGAESFKSAAKTLGVCIPNEDYINFRSENSDKLIYNAMSNLKKATRAKVVIVFSYLFQGERLLLEAQRQNITDRTWVTSDAWGTKTAKVNISKHILNGIFTFASASRKIPKFENYLRNLTFESVKGNEWLESYFSNELDSRIRGNDILSSSSNFQRYCNSSEKLHQEEKFSSLINEKSGNVIDAVYAVAHGLKKIFTCEGENNTSNCTLPTSATKLLLKSLMNTTFTSVYGTAVKFDRNGDKMLSEYTIRNLQLTSSRTMRYVKIGSWIKDGRRLSFIVNTTLIAWNSGKRPDSTCFRECNPGEYVVGKSECCWNCQRCQKGSISSVKAASSCRKCNETHYANKERTKCVLRKIIYLASSDPAGISVIAISIFGLLLTSAVFIVIVRVWNSPLIQDSCPILLCVFIVTLVISFFFSICYVITKPSNNSCAALNSLFLLLQMLYAIFLLAKTQQAKQWLRSAVSRAKMKMVYAQLSLVCILVFLQSLLIILWQSTLPSVAHYINEFDNARLLECREEYPVLRILATVFPLIVLAVATLIAFRERNLPENFNEAKFISFASIALCIVVIAFFPTYRYVRGISKVIVVTFTSFTAAFSCMGCIFIPKMYNILKFRGETNSSQFSQDCIANNAVATRKLYSLQPIQKSVDSLPDDPSFNTDQNEDAIKKDSSPTLSSRNRSKSNLQERFTLETLKESDTSEEVNETCPNEVVGINRDENSCVSLDESSKNKLVSKNLQTTELATKEFVL